MVLGHREVQHQQLVALAGVFKIAFACGLDPHRRSSAVDADRSCAGLGPDMDVFLALYSQDGQIRQPQYRINLGHGITSIELVFRTYKFNEYRRPPLMMKSPKTPNCSQLGVFIWAIPRARGVQRHSTCANPIRCLGRYCPPNLIFRLLFSRNLCKPSRCGTRRTPFRATTYACVGYEGFAIDLHGQAMRFVVSFEFEEPLNERTLSF